MKKYITFIFSIILFVGFHFSANGQKKDKKIQFITADHSDIQYTGRIDFSNPKAPRFWLPGVYIKIKFYGTSCEVVLKDEELGGNTHNYLEIILDDQKAYRIQTTGKENTIRVAEGLPRTEHTLTICKDTENNIGYVEFLGVRCEKILPLPPKPTRKLEFIGNSITCGTGIDLSGVPCGKGRWHDQHNAYMSYGALTARELNTQWHLSAYSGIGLIRSCCNLPITMPMIFDKVRMDNNSIPWDFTKYQPDAVTICLGQNDGIQDSTKFCTAYVDFLTKVRSYYPNATLVCLTSPMANDQLRTVLQKYLTGVVNHLNISGDKNVHKFFFSRSWNNGCDGHPDMNDHQQIAGELIPFLKITMGW